MGSTSSFTACFARRNPSWPPAGVELPKLTVELIGVIVISIGFNQPFDSPDALRSFARAHRIEHANWEFLSPPRERVEALTQAFGFSYVATPAGFDHLLGVTVVAPDGRIHAQVYGDRLRPDQLGEPLRQLILNAPPAP